uniref:Uncharacterized protein n=1 Tax=Anguilla anguilla TaxID=7936 RepID=A0A0E9QDJ4_ANGAN
MQDFLALLFTIKVSSTVFNPAHSP